MSARGTAASDAGRGVRVIIFSQLPALESEQVGARRRGERNKQENEALMRHGVVFRLPYHDAPSALRCLT
jgi:hypothetical protein